MRTNKNKTFIAQMAKHSARERALRFVAKRMQEHDHAVKSHSRRLARKKKYTRLLEPQSSPHVHYHIAQEAPIKLDITRWLGENRNDPALTVSRVFCAINRAWNDQVKELAAVARILCTMQTTQRRTQHT